MPDALAVLAVGAGKTARAVLHRLGHGATALPGLITLTVDPGLIGELSGALPHGAVCVSGTNGKTTTARMLADIVRAAGWGPVHNRAGSNLERGIAAALLADATWLARPRGDVGIYEVDEASVPRVLGRFAPRVMLVTNLFRDQLDRYFEIDALARRIGDAFARLPATTTLVLNADDPIVASLGARHAGPTLFFGVDDPRVGGTVPQAISDATRCPRCRSPLRYRRVVLAHVGDWECPACGLERPDRDLAAAEVRLLPEASELRFAGAVGGALDPLVVPLPGLYNAYN
ncbi:MAG: Mur ligase family protein, partial [Candidatus Limnocylindria bacterium]